MTCYAKEAGKYFWINDACSCVQVFKENLEFFGFEFRDQTLKRSTNASGVKNDFGTVKMNEARRNQ